MPDIGHIQLYGTRRQALCLEWHRMGNFLDEVFCCTIILLVVMTFEDLSDTKSLSPWIF